VNKGTPSGSVLKGFIFGKDYTGKLYVLQDKCPRTFDGTLLNLKSLFHGTLDTHSQGFVILMQSSQQGNQDDSKNSSKEQLYLFTRQRDQIGIPSSSNLLLM
jgi:hypothetical protein